MSSFSRARVVLVGNGRMGKIRANLLYSNPRFEISGIVDTDTIAASALAKKYQTKPFQTVTEAYDYHEKLSKDKSPIQGVVVSTPTPTHDGLVRESAGLGLDVFTEKPVDETAVKIRKLFDFSIANGSRLCCSFQRRFDESYVAVRDALNEGVVGRPLTARVFFGDHPCPPEEFLLTPGGAGDIFVDLSAHDVDYARWCLNDEVESVYATGTSSNERLADAGVHDNATLLLNFTKGTVVTMFMSRSASYGYDQRCEIFGDGGLLQVENEHGDTSVRSTREGGVRRSNLKHSFPERFHRAFAAELDAFADTLLLGTPWPVRASDCVAVQRVSDAARLSCRTNEVVRLESLVVEDA